MTDVVDAFSAHRRPSSDLQWEPVTTALLVVDMVNDFCSEGGAMVLPGSNSLYPVITALADGVRSSGGTIVWIRDQHEPNDREFRKRTPHCLAGTWGTQLVSALTPHEGDENRPKHTFSAFHATGLDDWLRSRDISTVMLCGVVTNICVRSTAHDAFFSGYDVLVAADACAGTSTREHDASLYDLDTHFASVGSTRELLAAGRRG